MRLLPTLALLTSLLATSPSFAADPPPTHPDLQVACYYFPDYHPGEPLNDRDHAPGWTEWELVKSAKPLFPGDPQPLTPLWGYTDESDPAVMSQKIDAAANAGIDSFIFDFYWYNGQPFLEKCLDHGFLKAPNRDRLQFALMWANHDWVDIFPVTPGKPQRLMYPGHVTPAQFDALCDHVIHDYFTQPNYWKLDGKPYFSIYELYRLVDSFGSVDATRAALDRFRAKAQAAGLPGIHLNAVVWGVKILPTEHTLQNPADLLTKLGFDSVTSYVWVHHAWPDKPQTDYNLIRDRYLSYWDQARTTYPVPYFPNVTVGWDPAPRNYQPPRTLTNNTPENFGIAVRLTRQRLEQSPTHPKVITINCWNEWTEGSELEPDTTHKMGYLDALRQALNP